MVATFTGWRARRQWSLYLPVAVAVVVLAVYEIWIGGQLPASGRGVSFAEIGNRYLHNSDASPTISAIRVPNPQIGGFDGQFEYFIALDPVNARSYVDIPAYRYERILYPLLAHLLALGRADLTAYALLIINLCAITGGTLAIASWLQRRGQSPWFALLYGFSPGLALGLDLDLTEPLAFALVALAVYLFDFGGRWRMPLSAVAFALAILARETTAVFALAYAAALIMGVYGEPSGVVQVRADGRTADDGGGFGKTRCSAAAVATPTAAMKAMGVQTTAACASGCPPHSSIGMTRADAGAQLRARLAQIGCLARVRVPRAVLFAGIALGPFLAFRLVLLHWLGGDGMPSFLTPTPYPFLQLMSLPSWMPPQQELGRAVIAPGLLIGAMALWSLMRGGARDVAVWLIVINVLSFIIFLNGGSFALVDAGRIAMGVIVAALYALPTLDRQLNGNKLWLWVSGALWISATPGLVWLPVARAVMHALGHTF